MRGGALPPGLLLAALALALAFAPARARLVAIALAGLCGLAAIWAPAPAAWAEVIFAGCWLSVAVTALSVHLPAGLGSRGAWILGANAGLWSGAVIAVAGEPIDLAKASIALLLCPLAVWAIRRRGAIAVKTVASWLLAVAVLAATLPMLAATPGYVPDHMQ